MKFGKRLAGASTIEALRYKELKGVIKSLCSSLSAMVPREDADATPNVAGLTMNISLAESAEVTSADDASRRFVSALMGDLSRLCANATSLAVSLNQEITCKLVLGNSVRRTDVEANAALADRVDALHLTVTLSYIGALKLVKKWNKKVRLLGMPNAAVEVLPILLQRTARFRLVFATPPPSVPVADLAAAAESSSGSPMPPAPLPIPMRQSADSGAAASASGPQHAAVTDCGADAGSLPSASPADGSDILSPSTPPHTAHQRRSGVLRAASEEVVRCNGCIQRPVRFVLLGCNHSFCWSCLAIMVLRSRNMDVSTQGLGAGFGLAMHRTLSLPTPRTLSLYGASPPNSSASLDVIAPSPKVPRVAHAPLAADLPEEEELILDDVPTLGALLGSAPQPQTVAAAGAAAPQTLLEAAESAAAARADTLRSVAEPASRSTDSLLVQVATAAAADVGASAAMCCGSSGPLQIPQIRAGGGYGLGAAASGQSKTVMYRTASLRAPSGHGIESLLSGDLVPCCVCDVKSDMSKCHLELNPLLGKDALVLMLDSVERPENTALETRQHGTKRSLFLGIDFGAMAKGNSPAAGAGA